MDNKLSNL